MCKVSPYDILYVLLHLFLFQGQHSADGKLTKKRKLEEGKIVLIF